MRSRLVTPIALALLGSAGDLAAQSRIGVIHEPGSPVIATAVLLAAGPIDEDSAKAGLAYLSARAVTEPLQAVMDSLGAHLAVEGGKDAVSFMLTAAPDAWEEASRRLFVALFRDPADSLAFARERRAITSELRARRANPADAVTREADAAFFGPRHPWGRPAIGEPQTVERLSLADVAEFLRANYLPGRAVAVVAGPIEDEFARQHLSRFLGPDGPVRLSPPENRPVRSPVRRDYNSITTWISASFPFPADADEEAIRFLAHLATESLSFGPTRHSVYNARSEVVRRIGGGEVRIQVVIPPDEAGDWSTRIQEMVAEAANTRVPDDVFEGRVRRYRGERLLEIALPEARANEAARRLLVTGRNAGLMPLPGELTPERLRSASASLGPPVVVVLGPFLE